MPFINGDQNANGSGSGGAFVEQDPTVSLWAKQPQKPEYTYDETGAAAQNHTHDREEILGRPTLYNATCSTSGSATGKVLTGLPEGYEPQAGDFVMVKFSYSNTAKYCYIFISGKSYAIQFNGLSTNTTASAWKDNSVFPFYFDGTNFNQLSYAKETDDDTTSFNQFIRDIVLPVNRERAILSRQLILERADSTFDAALTNTSITTAKNKPVNKNTDFKVDGPIWFNDSEYSLQSGNVPIGATYNFLQVQGTQVSAIVQQALNGADHLKPYSWVYLIGIPQENPMVCRLDPDSFTSWYTTDIPTTEDGKVYIQLGRYNSSTSFSLFADHPAYWFKDGAFRPYLTRGETPTTDKPRPALFNAACDTAGGVSVKDLTELPGDYEPARGDMITVRFANGNSAANCAFTITGRVVQYQIKFNGLATNTTSSAWKPGGVFQFFFDGTDFHQLSYAN